MKQPDQLIRQLQQYSNRDDRGTLASLRRGMGMQPGAVPETARIVEHMLDDDDSDSTRDALYVVGPLYAFHPLLQAGDRWNNLGAHFRVLTADGEPSPSVERRFTMLLASEPDELPDALRQAISLLKSQNVPVNWQQLFVDVQKWMDRSQNGEAKRKEVRLAWSRSFWRMSTTTDKAAPSQPVHDQPAS
jgi:CRISPR system Cascade subunit CasB